MRRTRKVYLNRVEVDKSFLGPGSVWVIDIHSIRIQNGYDERKGVIDGSEKTKPHLGLLQ